MGVEVMVTVGGGTVEKHYMYTSKDKWEVQEKIAYKNN